MNRKGISLVALVITIIVLIILTAAVVITGINVPENANEAVRAHNVATVQDAVTIAVMNHIADNTTATTMPTVRQALTTLGIATFGTDDPNVIESVAFEEGAETKLGVAADALTDLQVDETGKVTEAEAGD